jgi:L-ascorbate metabolism protein UlaG (beta-lactamase superfamily)
MKSSTAAAHDDHFDDHLARQRAGNIGNEDVFVVSRHCNVKLGNVVHSKDANPVPLDGRQVDHIDDAFVFSMQRIVLRAIETGRSGYVGAVRVRALGVALMFDDTIRFGAPPTPAIAVLG